ncbi:MAG: CBS domain-containing protein [Acidimicrobiia bacterium]
MREDIPRCELDEPIGAVRERTEAAGWNVCVVVNQEGVVMGMLGEAELGEGAEETAEAVMRPGPTTFRPHVDIGTLAHHMAEHDLAVAPITTSDGRLVGVLRREEAMQAAHNDRDHPHAGEEGHDAVG